MVILKHLVRGDADDSAVGFGEVEDLLHGHGKQARLILGPRDEVGLGGGTAGDDACVAATEGGINERLDLAVEDVTVGVALEIAAIQAVLAILARGRGSRARRGGAAVTLLVDGEQGDGGGGGICCIGDVCGDLEGASSSTATATGADPGDDSDGGCRPNPPRVRGIRGGCCFHLLSRS
uniref:Uncharacterized protein n=1 Tax=Arundo donax TaxID=35708 RepID=A0A0A9EB94_ARUDO